MSAWIEIIRLPSSIISAFVALLVSAWIEILGTGTLDGVSVGRTPRECVD